jgi:hypothetical protein
MSQVKVFSSSSSIGGIDKLCHLIWRQWDSTGSVVMIKSDSDGIRVDGGVSLTDRGARLASASVSKMPLIALDVMP